MAKLSSPPAVDFNTKPGRATRPEHVEAAALARKHPGEWVELDDVWPSNTVAIIKSKPGALNGQGHLATPPPYREGVWDATQRSTNGSKKVRIWVRFLGEDGSPARVLSLVAEQQHLEKELKANAAALKKATLEVAKHTDLSEAEIADLARIDRATLRQWQGKKG